MTRLLFAALLALLPRVAAAQASPVELDHVFVVVPPGALREVEALRAAGLSVPAMVTRHRGQGTASRSIVFGNAYLELLWVDSTVATEPGNAMDVARFRRAAEWRRAGVSPFGVGLRRTAGAPDSLGVPSRRYTAPWMPPGTAIELLVQDADSLAAEAFVVPAPMALPSWIASLRMQAPAWLQHPGGGERVTAVRLHGPRAQHPAALRALRAAPLTLVESDSVLVEIELDGGARNDRRDLRPLLPLVIVR